MNKLYWVLVLVIIIAGGWYLMSSLSGGNKIIATTDVSEWQEYADADWGISLKHPEAVAVDQLNANLVKFLLIGPTQSVGTEMYDGISMEVARQQYEGDLKSVIEGRIEESQTGMVEITKPLSQVNLGGVDGYTYSFSGLGKFDVYYLPKNEREYFLIPILVEDPSGQGYEEIAHNMLASFVIN